MMMRNRRRRREERAQAGPQSPQPITKGEMLFYALIVFVLAFVIWRK